MNTLIAYLKKHGFDISTELGVLRFNFLISQLVIMVLLLINTGFLDSVISISELKLLVILGMVAMLVTSGYSVICRVKQKP